VPALGTSVSIIPRAHVKNSDDRLVVRNRCTVHCGDIAPSWLVPLESSANCVPCRITRVGRQSMAIAFVSVMFSLSLGFLMGVWWAARPGEAG
jgi:hypothetical protein